MRKTKIICTLGPSTDDENVLRSLIKAGMNVARLNFSHGDYDEQLRRINMVKKLRDEMEQPIAILLDTKGPEIRIGEFENKSVVLEKGQNFTLTTRDVLGNENEVSISYSELPYRIKPGDRILIDDGLVELIPIEITETDIQCFVRNGGKLSNKKSINLPGINLDMPYMTQKDRDDIIFGIKHNVDFIAASFVRCESDVKDVFDVLQKNGGTHIKVIAKIENNEGVENIDGILAAANGIMVARGDMGVEISFEKLPAIQKMLIKKCYAAGKIAITATQMLDSMVHNPRPTRAEVSDVANAVYDGTSAIMLSGETAAGDYPVESVITMSEIAECTENSINYTGRFLREKVKNNTITDAVCHASCTTAIDLNASAIVALTLTGHTARMISKFRPNCPIIAATTNENNYHQLALSWGVIPVMNDVQKDMDALFESAIQKLDEISIARHGDRVIIIGGAHLDAIGISDVMRVHTID